MEYDKRLAISVRMYIRMSGGMRKYIVTSIRNRIIDRRIVASEQARNTYCSSFDILTISLSMFALILSLRPISCVGVQKKWTIYVRLTDQRIVERIRNGEIGIRRYPRLILTLRKTYKI